MYEGITVFTYSLFDDSFQTGQIKSDLVEDLVCEWRETPKGKWCIEHAVSFKIIKTSDYSLEGNIFEIRGLFRPKDATMYRLKWADIR